MPTIEEPQLLTDEAWAEVRALAASVARTISDLGLPVWIDENHVRLGPGNLPTAEWTEHVRQRRAAAAEADLDARRPGATVTTVVDERVGRPPFVGVCVTWTVAEGVRKAGLAALEGLLEADDGFPDPLPEPMRRSGHLAATMRDAIRAALAYDGFDTREDTDYRPYGLWLVGRPGVLTDQDTERPGEG